MASRMIWALLVLSAVFVMHGVPSLNAPAEHAGLAQAPQALVQSSTDAPGVYAQVHDAAPSVVTPADRLTPSAIVDDSPSHPGMAAHVWAACLAVLLLGVALLGAHALVRGSVKAFGQQILLRGRRTLWALPVARPPDLSALCLLRI